jgi:ankyrin repeat protein
MLTLIVAYGARFNLPCSRPFEWTALQRATQHGSFELVAELIRLGSDVHYSGPPMRGRSALQSAAARRYGGVHILRYLVEEHGADVNEPRSKYEGYTCLEMACHRIVQLKDESAISAVEFLVERGAVITPFTLHVAAAWNHHRLIQFLLLNGARFQDFSSSTNIAIVVEAVGDYRDFGPTVVQTARINGNMEFAEILENTLLVTPKPSEGGRNDRIEKV